MNATQIADRLCLNGEARELHPIVGRIKSIVDEAVMAERHRIYAALEADPGALWRDQGFQEWRKARVQD